ncbi:diguanylate cyclase [Desulfovibrio aerotolerans]|uniref:Diguanylate cyclase n=1 Tax=Solidesulfovibrio aerotolerans TaxID=295255 RepID=A0A7C9IPI9_9BACT|nr:sensor domain-containing diguanylate cyclase [Solidesulfovibrio aerotolerans]MYL85326.1 diguanylate cyclase [Solidesulfovibrio aerotolerans]
MPSSRLQRTMATLQANEGYLVFKQLIDSLMEHVVILDTDGTIVAVNKAWTDFSLRNFGGKTCNMEGINYLSVCEHATGPASREAAAVANGLRDVLCGKFLEFRIEYPCHSPTEKRWFLLHAAPLMIDGNIQGAVVFHIPVTERMEAEHALLLSETRFTNAFNYAPIGMALVSPEGRFLKVNPSLCDMFGYSASELESMRFWDLTHAEDLDASHSHFQALLDNRVTSYRLEKRYVVKDGTPIWGRVSVSAAPDSDGGPLHLVAQIEDIDRQKKLEQELTHLATTDPLTGACNRRHFLARADEEFYRSKRYGTPLSFLMADIDHFKNINDRYGHAVGDVVLKDFTRIICVCLRQSDTIGRLGGEEFGILLPETEVADALTIAQRIINAMAETVFDQGNYNVSATVSIGIATMRENDVSIADLSKRADDALYTSKDTGRNRATVFREKD